MRFAPRFAVLPAVLAFASAAAGQLTPVDLQVEMRVDPEGIDALSPRLSWRVESPARAQTQSACRILVAGSPEALAADRGDLWDSGKVAGGETMHVAYAGKPLASQQACFWKVKVWDGGGRESGWSAPARWSMGLLGPADWKAQWISFRDPSPVHASRDALHLPPARHYRKTFAAGKPVKRAVAYASALGLVELEINGRRAGDAWFMPGWSDYAKRAYYRTLDVTGLVQAGDNALGAVVADGWYAGYVGYGLLCGYGPHGTGRSFYGKTPALLVQLEIDYADGSRETVVTDPSWKVTGEGPIREADLLMGETHDARREMEGWSRPGFDDAAWAGAVPAEANGGVQAPYTDPSGPRTIELGFRKPPRLQAYAAPPIRVTQEVKAVKIAGPKPGVHLYDLGQNIAGVIRLKVRGPAGATVTLRYGEMLHPDGRLMTENLRRARVTDAYTLRGGGVETWTPRFTYHGFRYVELSGLTDPPEPDAVTGLVLHSDTPLVSAFECSDPLLNRLFENIVWTQRGNFVEVPTDCPQRDERLGWMGDAQIYARAATYNADVAAFFTKWLDDVEEAQHPFGAFPDYSPYPMAHGQPGKPYGTAWMDAGIIVPWTMWRVYGDARAVERHFDAMRRFMEFRAKAGPTGESIGNPWGDWLNVGEDTPIEYIDLAYHARTAALMAEMAEAIGRKDDATEYRRRFDALKADFLKRYFEGGKLKVDTQTAHALALDFGLLPEGTGGAQAIADRLAEKIVRNGGRMATGFLGTQPLLPVLSAHGHHDLAVRLFQSREFPSWGFEVANGATTVWERWDSYTKADGFGRHNAAMNSFSHYAFGAVGAWMFRDLAGIETDGPGFQRILIRPGPPPPGAVRPGSPQAVRPGSPQAVRPGSPQAGPGPEPIRAVKASYGSRRGRIAVDWKRTGGRFELAVEIPANTTATVLLPAADPAEIREGGRPLDTAEGVRFVRMDGDRAVLEIGSGRYAFASTVSER